LAVLSVCCSFQVVSGCCSLSLRWWLSAVVVVFTYVNFVRGVLHLQLLGDSCSVVVRSGSRMFSVYQKTFLFADAFFSSMFRQPCNQIANVDRNLNWVYVLYKLGLELSILRNLKVESTDSSAYIM
jgi:hypothetical protein